ncbi:hypothetical protein DFA_05106 [Cavenderia fasciculata]|uniref:Uncharacterized protein n=1 Tax=Cavenderia fasciculata TaxID=261658 RepID=F4PNC3_CACFS|nr:uncharacterized protein DFA_05106 [Cavenderia fasciculata]EGG22976.1 hypothetical protein DFA_05106 [Cavenderia fasciculata]|eukprot:XP_004360827.1 hypothetical protein DFA_05106 [Cavenderia fasciculata]
MSPNKEEELFRKIIRSVVLRTIIFNHVREIRMLLGTTLYKIPGTKYTVDLGQLNQHHRFIERKLGALDTINSLLQNSVSKLVKRSIQLMSLENVNDGGSTSGSGGGGLRCRHLALSIMELYTDQESADYCVEAACEAVDKYHNEEPVALYVASTSLCVNNDDDEGDNQGFGQLVAELPIESLQTIAKMLAVDTQECFDKKDVIQKNQTIDDEDGENAYKDDDDNGEDNNAGAI